MVPSAPPGRKPALREAALNLTADRDEQDKRAGELVTASGHVGEILGCLLGGVALQVIGALVNKWAGWHLYATEIEPKRSRRGLYRFWAWVNDQDWIDAVVDSSTVLAFAWATFGALSVFP